MTQGLKMSDRKKYSYDKECEALADYFLADEALRGNPKINENVKELAQAIQDAVEDWFISQEEPRRP